MNRTAVVGLLLSALLLGACGGRVSLSGGDAGGGTGAPGPAVRAPVDNMSGRWRLSAANGAACGMNFGGAPGAVEGTIAPEGGCPGNFFTSRRWTFDENGLSIRNHRGEALAGLRFRSPNLFDGPGAGNEALTLSR